jgi:hypothetical protein
MPAEIDAPTLKAWLSDGREIALFDVREHGQYGAGHPFFSVPLPYSRFEIELPRVAPNAAVPLRRRSTGGATPVVSNRGPCGRYPCTRPSPDCARARSR